VAESSLASLADANVVVKWFHEKGEEEVEAARGLRDAHRDRRPAIRVLDLTAYEVGNALMRGRARLGADHVRSCWRLHARSALPSRRAPRISRTPRTSPKRTT
jgi:predicted nucleic acid-binding protein